MNYTDLVSMPTETALIYKIEHVDSGAMYIGSTVEPKRRWRNHMQLLEKGLHTSFVLQRAWCKYGKNAFVFKALVVCPRSLRNFYETNIIKGLGTYNLLKEAGSPAPGSMKGKKHTVQARKNLSEGARRRWAKLRQEVYDPLCVKAWELVEAGLPRYKACKQVGVSHDNFWNWMGRHGKKEGIRGRFNKKAVA